MSKRIRKPKYTSEDYVTGEEYSDGEDPADDEEYRVKPSPKRRAAPKPKPPMDPYVDEMHWMIVPPSLIWRDFNTHPSTKIAAFDLDGTLVVTKSGLEFPRDENDWEFYSARVVPVLRDLYQRQGYKIVLFSNQGGIKSALVGKAATNTKNRIMHMIKDVNIPMLVFMATQSDGNRKPETGMWQYFITHCNGNLPVDPHTSFFCGDADGSPGNKVGSGDRDFAHNVGLVFKTPEQVFGPPSGEETDHPNRGLIDMFKGLASQAAQASDDPNAFFKKKAFDGAAKALTEHREKITLDNIKEAGKLKGIGKGSLAKIQEYLSTGEVKTDATAAPAPTPQQTAAAKAADAFL